MIVAYNTINNFEYECLLLLETWANIPEVKCYGSTGDKYAAFLAPSSGEIEAVRLTHFSGNVSCDTKIPNTVWGCGYRQYFTQDEFLTLVTDSEKNVLFPSAQYRMHISYRITGADVETTKSIILKSDPPRIVKKGDEFQIWYGEDLAGVHDSYNDPNALHCLLVALKYC